MNGSTHHKDDTPGGNGELSEHVSGGKGRKEGKKRKDAIAHLSGKPVSQRTSHESTEESTKFENRGQETLGVSVVQLQTEELGDAV